MKKVFIVHGFMGMPNGGWRPWLMRKLADNGVWACSLSMPTPEKPEKEEWVNEINRMVGKPSEDIFLVGHSLGVPAILRYLEFLPEKSIIGGIVLVSGPCEKNDIREIDNFFNTSFNFSDIRSKVKKCFIVQVDNDPYVSISNAMTLSKELGGGLTIIANGGHLNNESKTFELPEALSALEEMMK